MEGRGPATAAVRELLYEAFAAPDVRTVVAATFVKPSPCVRMLKKAGFVHQARFPTTRSARPRAIATGRKHPGSTAGDVAKALDTVYRQPLDVVS